MVFKAEQSRRLRDAPFGVFQCYTYISLFELAHFLFEGEVFPRLLTFFRPFLNARLLSRCARGVKKTGLVTFPPPFVSGEHFSCRRAQAGENFEEASRKEAVGPLVSRAHLPRK